MWYHWRVARCRHYLIFAHLASLSWQVHASSASSYCHNPLQADRSIGISEVHKVPTVEILQHLTSIKSLANHSISPVCFWTIDEGTIFSMPNAGGWVTSTQNLESNLFSIAKQLIEGVAFMHEHGVAHLDLKPENIIVDSSTGQLSIIDYSVSQRVSGTSEMLAGFAGMPRHIAPEVGDKPYSPIRADLWSCGNVLHNLSYRCRQSSQRDFLLRVCDCLMSKNPLERPHMSEVVRWMSDWTDKIPQGPQMDGAASKQNVCELHDSLFHYDCSSHITWQLQFRQGWANGACMVVHG